MTTCYPLQIPEWQAEHAAYLRWLRRHGITEPDGVVFGEWKLYLASLSEERRRVELEEEAGE